jgi:hypothetical protein
MLTRLSLAPLVQCDQHQFSAAWGPWQLCLEPAALASQGWRQTGWPSGWRWGSLPGLEGLAEVGLLLPLYFLVQLLL